MFLPFIPYLVMLAALTALLALPPMAEGAVPPGGWELLVAYMALVLLGSLVGHLPDRWVGRLGRRASPEHRASGLRRRVLFIAVWLAALGLSDYPNALIASLQSLPVPDLPAQESVLALLMLNYWLGEAQALAPLVPWQTSTLGHQVRELQWHLRLPAPILAVILVGLGAPALADGAWLPAWEELGTWSSLLGSLLAMLAVAGIAVPVLMRVCWGLQPLERHPLGGEALAGTVWDELRANKVRVARVLAWPDELMGFSTAGVVGVLPPFRYLLFSPRLAVNLTPDEVRAVTAHEAGHLRHGHLWFLLLGLLGFVLLAQSAVTALFWAGMLVGSTPPLWLLIAGEVGALLLFLRFGLGYISRNFERQADAQAVRRTGAEPLASSLHKLAGMNGIAPSRDNWHHYGIVQRIDFARAATEDTAQLSGHDRRVRTLKTGVALFCALAIGSQVLMASDLFTGAVGERVLSRRMMAMEQPGQEDLTALRFLASRAYAQNKLDAAERWFRKILTVIPEDPQAQNNLAWVLVTRPGGNTTEYEEGLRLATAAVRESDQAFVWDTLAEAYDVLGRGSEALDAARRALERAESGQGRGSAPLDYYRERVRHFGG